MHRPLDRIDRAAVDATLASATSIDWGLKLYPSPGGAGTACSVSAGVDVPIAAASASAIQSQLATVSFGGSTPTTAAIAAATAYLKTVTDGSSKAILWATDGEPNCKGGSADTSDASGTVTAIGAAYGAGFPVYVIGIGPSVANLDTFAQAGGTGHYYPAQSSEELVNALSAVSAVVSTCTFALAKAPPDANNLAVYLDKSVVPKDSSNGWSFGANNQTIVLTGSSCDAITSGAASSVQVLFGCPGTSAFPPVLP